MLLVDGGLSAPIPDDTDPQAVVAAVLGPALARLRLRFASREAYHDWWRAHPAFAHGDVSDPIWSPTPITTWSASRRGCAPRSARRWCAPTPRSCSRWASRRTALEVPAELLSAERGMVDDPNPHPAAGARGAMGRRRAGVAAHRLRVADVNHYTLVMGAPGARAVAEGIVRALQSPAFGRGLRSAG